MRVQVLDASAEPDITFVEDGVTRKRWLRVVFWGDGELIMMAQGSTPQEYAHWKAMFYNSLMTVEIA